MFKLSGVKLYFSSGMASATSIICFSTAVTSSSTMEAMVGWDACAAPTAAFADQLPAFMAQARSTASDAAIRIDLMMFGPLVKIIGGSPAARDYSLGSKPPTAHSVRRCARLPTSTYTSCGPSCFPMQTWLRDRVRRRPAAELWQLHRRPPVASVSPHRLSSYTVRAMDCVCSCRNQGRCSTPRLTASGRNRPPTHAEDFLQMFADPSAI